MKPVLALALLLSILAALQAEARGQTGGAAALGDDVSARSIYQLDSTWRDDAGSPFSLLSLRGHPVVISMIFTRCSSACPLTVERMKQIEKSLPASVREGARFVLVSFDAEGDTPRVLHAYRGDHALGTGRWILLHGRPEQIRELAMVLGVGYTQLGPGVFNHSSVVSVLNRHGEIACQRENTQDEVAELAQAVTAAR